MRRFAPSVLAAAVIALVVTAHVGTAGPHPPTAPADPAGLVVHEWGTFTSVADVAGSAVEWIPQQGPSDLPCFVDRVKLEPKSWLRALVRMETPVLYFYAQRDTTVDVRVRFNQGLMTEWYPKADVSPLEAKAITLKDPKLVGSIAWNGVRVLPKAAETYPGDNTKNHYYAARATDASPVQVGAQREKFLFYRGITNFEPPLLARIALDGTVHVKAAPGETAGDLVLFENRGGSSGHVLQSAQGRSATLQPARLGGSPASTAAELERLLVARGLYPREARAMVDTWRDSWFEEGTRLFYIVSPRTVDAMLPLEITPAPSAVVRVFVGRIELLPSTTLDEVMTALARKDPAPLLKHRRFLGPIMGRVLGPIVTPETTAAWQFMYDTIAVSPRRSCG